MALSYCCTKPAQKCLGFGLNSSVGESPHQHPWGQHPAPPPPGRGPCGHHAAPTEPPHPLCPWPWHTRDISCVSWWLWDQPWRSRSPGKGWDLGLLHSVGLLRGSLWVLGSLLGGTFGSCLWGALRGRVKTPPWCTAQTLLMGTGCSTERGSWPRNEGKKGKTDPKMYRQVGVVLCQAGVGAQ